MGNQLISDEKSGVGTGRKRGRKGMKEEERNTGKGLITSSSS